MPLRLCLAPPPLCSPLPPPRRTLSVLLELLKHVENHSINTTQIKNLYDIWSKENGSMKT
ncbi:hypothetical protein JHK87_018920 [Glycine soja]|nr:hypothetical protein JHK87_018920 [Glycine soja]